MAFFQIQYLLHKYFYILILAYILFHLLIFLLYKNRIKPSSQTFYLIAGIIIIISIGPNSQNFYLIFNNMGWDYESICGWIEISKLENENLYEVQSSNYIFKNNYLIPQFSAYYHPFLIPLTKLLCDIEIQTFNLLSVFFIIIISYILSRILDNLNFTIVLCFLFFGFNNLYWLLKTGQFVLLEITALTLGLYLFNKHKVTPAIISLFIFGIQRIYFFILPLFIALKYLKFKGLILFLSLNIFISIIFYEEFIYFVDFWFGKNGYFLSKSTTRHSFFNESFGANNQSIFILNKSLINTLNITVENLILLLSTLLISFIVMFYFYKKLNLKKHDSKENIYILFLIVFLLFPLLKPYNFILFSIILCFILNELNNYNLTIATFLFAVFPTLFWYIFNPFLYVDRSELSDLNFIFYKIFDTNQFTSSWIIFFLVFFYIRKKNYKN